MNNIEDKTIPKGRWKHIIPATILVYIVAYMDRTNIAIGIAGGMNKDLGMTASFAGLVAGIFFIGYIFLQIPGGQIAERYSAKKFIAWTIVVWGGFAAITGFVRDPIQLLIIRFILGVAEGGVYPAILALIGHWFPNHERARAIAFFQMNLAAASIITGPLSGWLIEAWGWREMFIIEGIISLALLFVWMPLVSDYPHQAKWLDQRELNWLNQQFEEDKALIKLDDKASVKTVLSSINLWKLVAIYFFFQIGFYGFALWMPMLIKQLTGSGMSIVGLLTAAPYILCIFGQYYIAKLCDQTMNRRLYTAIPMIGFAICLTLSILLENNTWLAYGMMVLCGFFLQAYAGPFWTLPPLLFPSNVLGGVRGTINALGNLGGFIGPYLVGLLTVTVSKNAGLYTLVGALIIAIILLFTLPAITAKPTK
ncbi:MULTISPECIES: MFS transporter [Gilliamella]|uniref:2-ketogluconate transporter n=1 Tax=Gilliamella apis TaxID=1970738 RepID=A0A2V4DSU8_9GAMM|nr:MULTISPECIES: MFS transporter [Gilliamella]MBI0038518.1 MFS transporter [Gilliamella sp. B14384G10]MBI0040843.1 MFS transporter [Gilliamella sp. B14384G7]MBI0052542.1 MFS transporter [Gilliamella sp. B14384G13]MBI0054837.1 MFS transporter [Gilliamella sp. B14384H2]PXY90079.1 2-ketogluconate transporter [Gilliamella apis]